MELVSQNEAAGHFELELELQHEAPVHELEIDEARLDELGIGEALVDEAQAAHEPPVRYAAYFEFEARIQREAPVDELEIGEVRIDELGIDEVPIDEGQAAHELWSACSRQRADQRRQALPCFHWSEWRLVYSQVACSPSNEL